jgi:integrase
LTPAVEAIGRPDLTAYVLRHSFASLLAHEGRSAVYIAAQLGHSPDLSVRVYQHVISEFEDAPRLRAENAIRQAREGRVTQTA